MSLKGAAWATWAYRQGASCLRAAARCYTGVRSLSRHKHVHARVQAHGHAAVSDASAVPDADAARSRSACFHAAICVLRKSIALPHTGGGREISTHTPSLLGVRMWESGP
eukprot:scaffold27778_cov157-Isochrysis_galbana.AAC.3